MRNKILCFLAVPALCVGMFAGCVKNTDEFARQDRDFNNDALVQVYMAMVNATRNYVYVDNRPVTGAGLATGGVFPSSGYASALPGGLTAFLVRDTLSSSTQVPLSFAENLAVGKNYTIFVYDTITTPKQKTVQTDIVVPTDNSARIRFAYFVYNPTAIPNVDVFSFAKNANIFTNVPVTEVTNFINYPSDATVDTIYLRDAGTMNNIIKFSTTGSFMPKRSYTVIYRGSYRSSTKVVSTLVNR